MGKHKGYWEYGEWCGEEGNTADTIFEDTTTTLEFTGLLNAKGKAIFRAPPDMPPIGFTVPDEEFDLTRNEVFDYSDKDGVPMFPEEEDDDKAGE